MAMVFYIAGAVAAIATVLMIASLRPVHALLYLIVSLLAVAVVFYTLGAPFVAVLEIIIYAGAIMVLFVFVVMLLNLGSRTARSEQALLAPSAWIGPSILAAILLAEFFYLMTQGAPPAPVTTIDAQEVSIALYGPYLIAVELASMLLLGGLVAAYHLGRRRVPEAEA